MTKTSLKEEEIKADILNKLVRRGCWGSVPLPLDSLVNWLSQQVERKYNLKDGKRVRKAVRKLLNEGLLRPHKKGKAISLNPKRSGEIQEYIEKVLKSRNSRAHA